MKNKASLASDREIRWQRLEQWLQQWADLIRSFTRSRLAIIGLVLFGIILVLAVLAPIIAPHDPLDQDLGITLQPPAWEKAETLSILWVLIILDVTRSAGSCTAQTPRCELPVLPRCSR
jgi:ABC-type antimicrobial peptide transport system permease subunit